MLILRMRGGVRFVVEELNRLRELEKKDVGG